MRITDEELRALWQEGPESPPSECLPDEAWGRLLAKDAAAEERMRAAAHIASCAACADEYRALRLLQPWEAELNRTLSYPKFDRPSRLASWRAWWSAPQLAMIAAAAILLLAVEVMMVSQLLGGRRQNARLETELAENSRRLSDSENALSAMQQRLRSETEARVRLEGSQRQPQAQQQTPMLDAAIVDLEPRAAEAVRGSTAPQIVTRAANALAVTLVLHFPPLASRATLEVEVVDAAGQVRWTGRTTRDHDADTVTLALPAADYPAGDYVIRLFDVTRGRAPLAIYPIAVQDTPARR